MKMDRWGLNLGIRACKPGVAMHQAPYDGEFGLPDFLQAGFRFGSVFAGMEVRDRLLNQVLDFRFRDPLRKKNRHRIDGLEAITFVATIDRRRDHAFPFKPLTANGLRGIIGSDVLYLECHPDASRPDAPGALFSTTPQITGNPAGIEARDPKRVS
jgi:hypothetical protein